MTDKKTADPSEAVPAANPMVAMDEDHVEDQTRPLDAGMIGLVFSGLALAVSLFHLYANFIGTMSTFWLTGIHFAGFAMLASMRYPVVRARSENGRKAVLAFDMAFGIIVSVATLLLIASENAIYARGVSLAPQEWVYALIVIFGAIELTRRATGVIIPILIVLALTYPAFWGQHLDNVFRFGGLSVETIVFRTIFTDEGMFGTIANISATFVFLFILFGAFLVRSGAGEFIIDLARAVAGKLVGGPGYVAVFSSGLTGTISGSAVANTVSTGVITIPLMKRSGFPPRFAAGVEAASSTGGQLMPPIMGAGAFVMASYTQIPYLDIVAVSFLPALVYFLSVGFFVRIEAKKLNMQIADDDAPSAMDVLKRGGPSFLIPVITLIGLLIYGFTPVFAAIWAILSVIVSSWLTPNRMGPKAIMEALILGAKNMIMTGVLLVAVGAMVNVIAMTGIGNTFSLMVAEWAGGNLLIAILLIALASLVLGMGLPVTAAYIVLATLSAPALHALIQNAHLVTALVDGTIPEVARMSFMLADPSTLPALAEPMSRPDALALVQAMPQELLAVVYPQVLDPVLITTALLSAHMIIFWLSQDSNVTPPVCLTAFAAAAIAKTRPMATGIMSWKLAKGIYLMPVLFAYTNFLGGDLVESIFIFMAATLGVYALGAAIQGHMEYPLNWPLRILTGVSGVALMWPNQPLLETVGALVVLGILGWSIKKDRARQAEGAAGA